MHSEEQFFSAKNEALRLCRRPSLFRKVQVDPLRLFRGLRKDLFAQFQQETFQQQRQQQQAGLENLMTGDDEKGSMICLFLLFRRKQHNKASLV